MTKVTPCVSDRFGARIWMPELGPPHRDRFHLVHKSTNLGYNIIVPTAKDNRTSDQRYSKCPISALSLLNIVLPFWYWH